jgi:hypothetical protein
MELAGGAQSAPGEFERALSEYLQSLLAADAERLAADDEAMREIAIVIGLDESDARMMLARAVGAARRASLPWRRFRQPWLLGPLWASDYDPVRTALAIPGELERQATLAVLAPHADRLRSTAEAARRAGLETLRDLLVFGLKQQRTAGSARSPEEYRLDPEVQAMERRIADTGRARRAALRATVETVEALDPAYFQSNTQFRAFLAWNARRAMALFREGSVVSTFRFDSQDAAYRNLRESPDAESLRAFARRVYGRAWAAEVLGLAP